MRRPARRRPDRRLPARDEDGTVLVELVWLGVLLLVPLVYVVLAVFEVQRGAFAVSAAARAAGRAYAIADTDPAGERAAQAAARLALADQGLDDGALRLRFSCAPDDRCREPGSVITVVVESSVQLPLVPDALGGGAPRFALDATHTVPRGRFNVTDGPAGPADPADPAGPADLADPADPADATGVTGGAG